MKYLKTYEGFRIINEEIFGLFGSNGRKRYQKLVDKGEYNDKTPSRKIK